MIIEDIIRYINIVIIIIIVFDHERRMRANGVWTSVNVQVETHGIRPDNIISVIIITTTIMTIAVAISPTLCHDAEVSGKSNRKRKHNANQYKIISTRNNDRNSLSTDALQ